MAQLAPSRSSTHARIPPCLWANQSGSFIEALGVPLIHSVRAGRALSACFLAQAGLTLTLPLSYASAHLAVSAIASTPFRYSGVQKGENGRFVSSSEKPRDPALPTTVPMPSAVEDIVDSGMRAMWEQEAASADLGSAGPEPLD